jgi:hypothetical protein
LPGGRVRRERVADRMGERYGGHRWRRGELGRRRELWGDWLLGVRLLGILLLGVLLLRLRILLLRLSVCLTREWLLWVLLLLGELLLLERLRRQWRLPRTSAAADEADHARDRDDHDERQRTPEAEDVVPEGEQGDHGHDRSLVVGALVCP